MSNNLKSLAARRAHLVEQCAAQRSYLAAELGTLHSPFGLDGIGQRLLANRKLLLAITGVALGIVAMRPKRLLALAAGGLSLFQAVRKALPLLSR
jgi:hypothetical protein